MELRFFWKRINVVCNDSYHKGLKEQFARVEMAYNGVLPFEIDKTSKTAKTYKRSNSTPKGG